MTKQVPRLQSTLALFAAALATISCGVQADNSVSLKQSVWTPIFQTSEELGEIPGETVHHAQSILEHIKTMRIAAARSGIYALKNIGTGKELKGTLLQDYFTRRADKAIAHYTNRAILNQHKAASKASYLKGRIDEYLNLLETAKTGSNACLLKGESDGTAATRQSDKLEDVKCNLKQPEVTSRKRTTATITPAGFTSLEPNDGKTTNAQPATVSKRCFLFSSVSTHGYGNSNAAAADMTAVMGGYIKIPNTDAKVTLVASTKLHTAEATQHEPWTEAHQAIQANKGHDHADCKNETAEASTRADIKSAITALYGTKAPAEENIVKSKLTLILGDKPSAKLAAAEHEVNKEEIPDGIAGRASKKTLGEIDNQEELATLLAYYQNAASRKITELKQQLKEDSGQKDPKTTADVCSKITDKNECNNKAFCSYNESVAEGEKKCKFNETKASKSGVPVTQTQTGGAETTTEKCKGKPEKDCKYPYCKWEGKECKDSSILVTKQFALSVLAFLSFLEI
uniref:Variant surface glycoprotein 1125.1683 n=1 Tax=Trypanosoma brucei TaxID=5691 RepID=A0A1J0R7I0_9TRYP|nr:variant surface glycoprotein 1125.1683 [Trypanosoma brucei]